MAVRILPPAPVHRQRVEHPLPARHLLGEGRGHIPALPLVQLHRQGELELAVEPPVRPLVSVGSLLEKQHSPPELIVLLDQALDRDQDRALFDLPPRSVSGQAPPSAPLSEWTPAKITDGVWGARFQGDTRTLPDNLKGLTITVRTSRAKSWDASITEVVERFPDRLLVRTQRLERSGG